MLNLSRPWSSEPLRGRPFGPGDCLISEVSGAKGTRANCSILMRYKLRGEEKDLILHPYPKGGSGSNPARENFPARPRRQTEYEQEDEKVAREQLRRMNEVLARVQELKESLQDPRHIWAHLRAAWERAENEDEPRMAEIVRQSRLVLPQLKALEPRIRRILRRTRELTPLSRVQEMDRGSMRWLVRQPGRTIAERAGSAQRILAITRHENFDTPENRVLHAYVRLAFDVAREWMREHLRARSSARFAQVEAYSRFCKAFARMLENLEVSVAEAGITPNYVLMQDANYREIYDAWRRLLDERKVLDDLWAWQAETWTDFVVLAIVLAIDEIEDAELIAQSPIVWRDESSLGRWFEQDRPIAVFWLKEMGRVVEVQARPEAPGALLPLTRAHVSLRIADISQQRNPPRRVAVWTPHAFMRIDLHEAVNQANARLMEVQKVPNFEILRNGLILTPSHGSPETCFAENGRTRVDAIAMEASGEGLKFGLQAIRALVRSEIYR